MHSFPQTRCGSFECGLRSQFIYVLLNSPLPPLAFFDTQNKSIFAHEIGHTLGMDVHDDEFYKQDPNGELLMWSAVRQDAYIWSPEAKRRINQHNKSCLAMVE